MFMSRRRIGTADRSGKWRLRAWSALGVTGLVAGLASGMPASAADDPHGKPAARPVACRGQVYVSFGTPTNVFAKAVSSRGGVEFKPLSEQTTLYNALGLNPRDRFVYATTFGSGGNILLRFGRDGISHPLGPIAGLPPALYISGTFDDAGNYYVLADDTGEIYRIDVRSRSVTGVVDVPELADPELDIFDIAFRDGFLWGSTDSGAITRIDIAEESVDFFPGVLPGGSDFGGVFVHGNGDLGLFRNAGQLFRVRVRDAAGSDPRFTVVSTQTAPATTNFDATSCFPKSSGH